MSFANPLVITIGGSGGTAKSLNRVNQDAYGSEYLLRESTQEFRALIRHNKLTPAAGKLPLENHNLELQQTVYGTDGAPDVVRRVWVVIQNNKADTYSDVADLGNALTYLLSDTALVDLMGWVN